MHYIILHPCTLIFNNSTWQAQSGIRCWKATLATPTFDRRLCSGTGEEFAYRSFQFSSRANCSKSMVFFGALALTQEFSWTKIVPHSKTNPPHHSTTIYNVEMQGFRALFPQIVLCHILYGIIVIAQQFPKYILRVYHISRGKYVESFFFNQERRMRTPKKGKLKVLKMLFSANKLREKKTEKFVHMVEKTPMNKPRFLRRVLHMCSRLSKFLMCGNIPKWYTYFMRIEKNRVNAKLKRITCNIFI